MQGKRDIQFLIDMAEFEIGKGKYSKAEKMLNMALKVENRYELWFKRGCILCKMARYKDAKKCFEKCIELLPKEKKELRENYEKMIKEIGKR